jgi:hypothetical protein
LNRNSNFQTPKPKEIPHGQLAKFGMMDFIWSLGIGVCDFKPQKNDGIGPP